MINPVTVNKSEPKATLDSLTKVEDSMEEFPSLELHRKLVFSEMS